MSNPRDLRAAYFRQLAQMRQERLELKHLRWPYDREWNLGRFHVHLANAIGFRLGAKINGWRLP